MPRFKVHFSIDEARELLPDIRTRLTEVRELVAQIRREQQETGEQRVKIARGNGKGPVVQGNNPLIIRIQKHIDHIVGLGIQIKDLERGLIDFPHYLNGDGAREVFLCYEMSELDIHFWHEIDDGYMGRTPL